MKPMPPHIEKKLREVGRAEGLSEVEIIHVLNFITKLANLEAQERKRQMKKVA